MFFCFFLIKILINISKSYQSALDSRTYIDAMALPNSQLLIMSESSNEVKKTVLDISDEIIVVKESPSNIKIEPGSGMPREWLYIPSQDKYLFFRTKAQKNYVTVLDNEFNELKKVTPEDSCIYGKESFLLLLSNDSYVYPLFGSSNNIFIYLKTLNNENTPKGDDYQYVNPSYGKFISFIEFDPPYEIESTYNHEIIGLFLYEKKSCEFFVGLLTFNTSFFSEYSVYSTNQSKCEYGKLIKLQHNYLSFIVREGNTIRFLFGRYYKTTQKVESISNDKDIAMSCTSNYYHFTAELSKKYIISVFKESDLQDTLKVVAVEVTCSDSSFSAETAYSTTFTISDTSFELNIVKLKKFEDFFMLLYSYTEGGENSIGYRIINRLTCINKKYETNINSDYQITINDLAKKSTYLSKTFYFQPVSVSDGYFIDDKGAKIQLGILLNNEATLFYHSSSTSGNVVIKFKLIDFEDNKSKECKITFEVADPGEDIKQKEIKDAIEKIVSQMALNDSPNQIAKDDYIVQVYSMKNPPPNTKSEATNIDLGECQEELLKQCEDEELFIATVDLRVKDSKTNKVEYRVFDSKRKEVSLKYCEGMKVEMYYALTNVSLTNARKMMESNSVDIYNPKDSFFNDVCVPYSLDKVDVALSDRRTDIYENISICEENCEYNGIDFENERANCTCPIKTVFNTTVAEDFSEEIKRKNSFITDIVPINIDVVKCYKEFFSFSSLKNNIGFWFSMSLIVVNCSLFGLFFKEFISWKKKIGSMVTNQESAPACACPSKKGEKGIKIKIKKKKTSSTTTTANLSTSKSSKALSAKTEKGRLSQDVIELENETNYDTLKKLELKFDFEKKDVNNYPFDMACEKDKRNCLKMFWKILLEKHMLLRAIFKKSEFEIVSISLSVYVSYLGLYFTLNGLFYTNSLISERYHRKQDISFLKTMLKSVVSCVASAILLGIIKFSGKFSLLMDSIVQEAKQTQDYYRLSRNLVRAFQRNVIIFFMIELVFSFFFLYYLSCFCIIYHKTQGSWFLGGVVSFFTSLFVCIGICIGFSVFRYYSLKIGSKNLYNLQLFINKYY